MRHEIAVVPEHLDGARLDAALAELLGVSRTWATRIIDGGGAAVYGTPLKKRDRVAAGTRLELSWEPKPEPRVEPTEVPDLQIVHDDDDLVVIAKPAGVAAHPSLGWHGPTVLGALAGAGYRIASGGPPERQGIVHRLDQGTSGLMAVAKSERAYSELKRQFKAREVTKIYHTVVHGLPDPLSGTIEGRIGRDPRAEWKFAVTGDGKPSVTHYALLDAFRHAALLEVELETGRTHQIRVHMSAQRHPCVGDTVYGADPVLAERLGLTRQWLHAQRLELTHPATGERIGWESDYPRDLRCALDRLRAGVEL